MPAGILQSQLSPVGFPKRHAVRIGLGLLVSTTILFLWRPSLLSNIANDGFLPHSFCYLQKASLIRLHLISDLAIGASYVAISDRKSVV